MSCSNAVYLTTGFVIAIGAMMTNVHSLYLDIIATCCTQFYYIAVPSARRTPSERVVYVASSQTNITLSAVITSPSASVLTIQWRLDNTLISSAGYITTTQDGPTTSQRAFTLTIGTFDPSLHAGVYELLVAGPTGTAVSATWDVRMAGLSLMLLIVEYGTCNNCWCVGSYVTSLLFIPSGLSIHGLPNIIIQQHSACSVLLCTTVDCLTQKLVTLKYIFIGIIEHDYQNKL